MRRRTLIVLMGLAMLLGCPSEDDDDTEGDDDASDDDGGDDDSGDDDSGDDDTELPPDTELWVDNEAGADTNAGTEDEPLASIAAALDQVGGRTHIYVVATSTGYEGACVWVDEVVVLGIEGTPVVDGITTCDGRNALLFSRGNDVRFENLRLDATAYAGQSVRALIFSGLPDETIALNVGRAIDAEGPGFGQPGRSLISSSLCYDCRLEDSSSIGAEEHGIYWTNHQDGSVLRNNYVEAADGACIQLNADPETYEPGSPVQDGIMSGGIVDGNVLFDCGSGGGGAALNLAGVEDTVFSNNLIYGTDLAGGIASWDDGYSDWGDPGNFDFGCKNNRYLHNTIDCRGCDRHAMSFRNGSSGNTFENNIVITDSYDAIAVDPESNSGLVIDHNVYVPGAFFEDPDEDWIDLAEWQALGFDLNSLVATPGELFESAGDYHLAAGCPAVDAGVDAGINVDMDGDPRPQGLGFDIGADERI